MLRMAKNTLIILLVTIVSIIDGVVGFTASSYKNRVVQHHPFVASSSSSSRTTTIYQSNSNLDDEFASFAATLSDDDSTASTTATTTSAKRRRASSTTNNNKQWQTDLETLLAFDPTLPVAQRQEALAKLVNANEEIRSSILTAVQNRNIEPLLTPTQRKIQDGTRAVARQVTDDILPSLAASVRNGGAAVVTNGGVPKSPLKPEDVSRVGYRIFNALNTQFQQNLQTLAGDLMNPSRIPQRISQQTEDLLKEAQNIFAETPIGLNEPKYTVVYTTDSYEVRDYEAYNVATTTMGDSTKSTQAAATTAISTSASDDVWSVTEQGAAFNTLAAYIFGANQQQLVMEMTTPVTTTMSGEMRFYVDVPVPPEPLKIDETTTATPQFLEQAQKQKSITIEQIPAARLAVRRFTGFVTAGEVQRQKDALLAAIAADADIVELDVPHGSTVGHIIFQYNPPYTIPFVRRNEIAVPVTLLNDEEDL